MAMITEEVYKHGADWAVRRFAVCHFATKAAKMQEQGQQHAGLRFAISRLPFEGRD